jgi:hypothetical protein
VVPAGERALKNHPVDDFSERFFAQRKANPANKKSRACGYYYVVPAGERALKNHPVDDFSERFFALRKANHVQKISHLISHASGLFFSGPGGIIPMIPIVPCSGSKRLHCCALRTQVSSKNEK